MPDASPLPQAHPKVTDCHVHLAALPCGGNGCYVSPKMLKSPLFRFLIWKQGLDLKEAETSNEKYVANLLAELRSSRYVGRAVLLGMDGVYDARGKLDRQATEFLIGNDYVLKLAKSHPEDFWAGVSVNPQRGDAVEELQRCAEGGAKLVKWLPNAQQFDPGDRRYIPFYRELARLRLPLLSHVGYEFSLIGTDQSAGDPNKLRGALDEGVTVIAAHGCSHGLIFYEKFYQTFLDLVRAHTNFFSDISALSLPNRLGMLFRLRRHPELHHRLIFGTDYPLPVFGWACYGRVGLRAMKELGTKNRFDRQHVLCSQLGIGFGSLDKIVEAGAVKADS
ncbi:MAG: amidohydrolase family protein [Terriglobales bacterium]